MYSESMTFKCTICEKEVDTDEGINYGCLECAFHLTEN